MNQSSARNFSYVSIGRIVGTIIQALFYLLFAKLIGPESYGELNVIIALAGTFSVISRFGLNISVQVYQSKQESEFSNQLKILFVILTGVASLILIPVNIYASVLCFGSSLYVLTQYELLGLRQYKRFMINSILKSSLFFGLPVILYFIIGIPGVILGMAIASIIGSIPVIRTLKPTLSFNLKNRYKVLIQNFLVESSQLTSQIDKLIISFFFGNFIVGVYQFNLQILVALSVVPNVLSSFLLSEESNGVTHGKITKLSILFSVALTIVSIILAPFIVERFFSKYTEGIFSLQILLLALIPYTIIAVYVAKLMAKESTKVGIVSLSNVVILSILIVIFGHFLGLVGLSITIVVSSIINLMLYFMLYRRMENQ